MPSSSLFFAADYMSELQSAQTKIEWRGLGMQRAEGVTEELKKCDPLEWTQRTNRIAAAANEIVISEMVNC